MVLVLRYCHSVSLSRSHLLNSKPSDITTSVISAKGLADLASVSHSLRSLRSWKGDEAEFFFLDHMRRIERRFALRDRHLRLISVVVDKNGKLQLGLLYGTCQIMGLG